MFTNPQLRVLREGLAQSNRVLLTLSQLEKLAEVSPEHAPQIQELRTRRDYLNRVSSYALELHRELSEGTTNG